MDRTRICLHPVINRCMDIEDHPDHPLLIMMVEIYDVINLNIT